MSALPQRWRCMASHHIGFGNRNPISKEEPIPRLDMCVCLFRVSPNFFLFFFFFFFYYSLSSAHCFQPPHKEDRKSFLFFRITQALATRPSISNYEYIILFCRIEYLSKMFGEYLRNTHFSLLVFIQCRQNKKIFGLCTIKFFFFMLVANRDRSTNRKSEWAELCCYRGRKTSARKGWVHSVGKGIPLLVRKVTHRRFPQWRFRSVVVFVLFYFFFLKGRLFILYFPVFAARARLKRVATCLEN